MTGEVDRLLHRANLLLHELMETLVDLQPHLEHGELTEDNAKQVEQFYKEMLPVLEHYIELVREAVKGSRYN